MHTILSSPAGCERRYSALFRDSLDLAFPFPLTHSILARENAAHPRRGHRTTSSRARICPAVPALPRRACIPRHYSLGSPRFPSPRFPSPRSPSPRGGLSFISSLGRTMNEIVAAAPYHASRGSGFDHPMMTSLGNIINSQSGPLSPQRNTPFLARRGQCPHPTFLPCPRPPFLVSLQILSFSFIFSFDAHLLHYPPPSPPHVLSIPYLSLSQARTPILPCFLPLHLLPLLFPSPSPPPSPFPFPSPPPSFPSFPFTPPSPISFPFTPFLPLHPLLPPFLSLHFFFLPILSLHHLPHPFSSHSPLPSPLSFSFTPSLSPFLSLPPSFAFTRPSPFPSLHPLLPSPFPSLSPLPSPFFPLTPSPLSSFTTLPLFLPLHPLPCVLPLRTPPSPLFQPLHPLLPLFPCPSAPRELVVSAAALPCPRLNGRNTTGLLGIPRLHLPPPLLPSQPGLDDVSLLVASLEL
ncbi:hypothetical protein C7M84_020665 [Penaeus vannamei]|uniref:Uncharacterized protein n=1 Tax=Penaeus vannamei TaxID=6689 RepID=A0A423SBI2_PENVA|nr:hypothetical protein C7M84_020665 [Penaeus vannamei]